MELFKSDGSEDFFCSGIGWKKDMLSKKMSIEAPAVALSGKSRYLPKLCVFGNRKGVSQSDSTITGADISPPVRVFRRGLPEWTVDLTNYLPKHFPQQECAIGCDLHGYLALPVFDLTTRSCVGVIELLTSSKYVSYAHEVQQFHSALKTQNLSCPQAFDGTAYVPRQNELDKIMGILKTVCDIYNLPLAQTWVVSPSTSFVSHDKIIKKCCCSFDTKCIGKVCMSTTALPFYLKDSPKWQFRKECAERHLEQSSHGAVGRALLCRSLCFCRDVTILNAEEYSLVYLARMFKLASCFAIYLHSVENGDDYVLEFFLPPGMEDGRCVQDLVETLKQKIEGDPGFKLGSTESSDSESVVTDVSDTASSASTNVTSLEKRVEVNFKEFTARSFIFPIPFDLSELENEVVQMFNLEGDWTSILSNADLDFAISDSDSIIIYGIFCVFRPIPCR
ncbi:NIN-like protein [Artemisia annua]|uniref:NIN-like protein n=1 Tax=Artemisia annua TaxID=35608 RepID=A0A2U1KCB7_ARTAN|nr:NIN-like protein [Artemisia annua]